MMLYGELENVWDKVLDRNNRSLCREDYQQILFVLQAAIAAKGTGKGKSVPPASSGQLAVSDEAWAAMSGKQRKMLVRTQNMVLHITGPSHKAADQPPRRYKDAAGPVGNTGSWYESRGPWVV